MSTASELFTLLGGLRHQGFAGPVILVCAALYCVLGIVACARPLPAKTPVLAALLAISGAGMLGGGLALVVASRRAALILSGLLPDPRIDGHELHLFTSVDNGDAGLLLLAGGLIWTAIYGCVWIARLAARRPTGVTAGPTIALLIFAAVLGGLLLIRGTIVAGIDYKEISTEDAIRTMVETGRRVHGHARGALAAAAAAAVVLSGLLEQSSRRRAAETRDRRQPPRAMEKAYCLGLLALGALAFALTRGHAADARTPVSFVQGSLFADDDARVRKLPVVTRCQEWTQEDDGPYIEVHEGAAVLDGTHYNDPAMLARVLQNKRELHRQVGSGRRLPRGMLWIERGTKVADVLPYARAFQQGWSERANLAAALPVEVWEAQTLGIIARRARSCPVPMRWDSDGRPLSELTVWDDVAREAAATPDSAWAP